MAKSYCNQGRELTTKLLNGSHFHLILMIRDTYILILGSVQKSVSLH